MFVPWIDDENLYFFISLPCSLQDLAGYGVALAVGKEFANAFPGRTFDSPLVELLVKNGRNGKKNFHCFHIISSPIHIGQALFKSVI